MIVYCITSIPLENISFKNMEMTPLPVKGSKIYASARGLWSLSRAGSLSCHTCCDTGLWVLWSHYPKDQVHVELPFTTSWYRGLFLTRIPTGSEIHMKTPDKYSQVILIWLHGFQIMGDSTRFITVSMIETHRFTNHMLKKNKLQEIQSRL